MLLVLVSVMGTAVAQWLKCCATNRKVAGSIPAGVNGFFIDIKLFRSHYGPGVDSPSNRNELSSGATALQGFGLQSGRRRSAKLVPTFVDDRNEYQEYFLGVKATGA